jgi:SAM-dependent methyltransferase
MEGYEKDYHKHLHGHLYSNKQYYKVRAKLAKLKYFKNIPINAKVLEFGCGLGQNIVGMPNATGYDISQFSLEECRKKGIKVTDNLKKLKDNSFDIVFSAHVLEHLENPSEAILQMKKKLKNDGKLIIILPTERHRHVSNFNLEASQHLYGWTFKTFNQLLLKHGFRIVKNKYHRGEGFSMLLPLSKINFTLFDYLTQAIGYIHGTKEMMFVAKKK